MQKIQMVEFAITYKNGNITGIGRTGILQPKPRFAGGEIKWYEDKVKEKRGRGASG